MKTAVNYNSRATAFDDTCIFAKLGCTDSEAFNYDPAANEDRIVQDSLSDRYGKSICRKHIWGCYADKTRATRYPGVFPLGENITSIYDDKHPDEGD